MTYAAALFMLVISNAPMLSGFVLPPVVEYLNRDVKKEGERLFMSFLVCFLVACALHAHEIVTGYADPTQVAGTTGIIFTESYLVFKRFFQNSSLQTNIQSIGMAVPPYVPEDVAPLPTGDSVPATVMTTQPGKRFTSQ